MFRLRVSAKVSSRQRKATLPEARPGTEKIRPSARQAWAGGLLRSGPKLNTKPPNVNTQHVAEMLSVITRQRSKALRTRAAAATTIAA
jgi:hypothetical protein